MSRTLLLALALSGCAGTTINIQGRGTGLGAVEDLSVEEQYQQGLRYMKRGNTDKARESFNRIRNYHRDDPYAVKAELALADLHFEQQEWDQARVAYEDFLRLHPRHEDIDYVVYRLGMVAYKKAPMIAARDQTWTRQAVNTWTGFDTRFAESEHIPEVDEHLTKARDRLARKEFLIGEFYFKRGAWGAVVGRMEGMLRQYPDASDVPEALAMLAVARWELGEQDAARAVYAQLAEQHPEARALLIVRRRAPELAAEAAAP